VACKTIRTFFNVLNVFFSKTKNMTFYVFLSCRTRLLEHCWWAAGGRWCICVGQTLLVQYPDSSTLQREMTSNSTYLASWNVN